MGCQVWNPGHLCARRVPSPTVLLFPSRDRFWMNFSSVTVMSRKSNMCLQLSLVHCHIVVMILHCCKTVHNLGEGLAPASGSPAVSSVSLLPLLHLGVVFVDNHALASVTR